MNIVKLLSHLRSLNIKIWLDGDRLRVKAPSGVMTPDLKKQMAANKEEILRFLRDAQAGAKTTAEAGEESPLPLSVEQQRAWLLDHFSPNPEIANVSRAFRILGPLKVSHIEQSIKTVAERHQALRTLFPDNQGKPGHVHTEQAQYAVRAVNLRTVAEEHREQELQHRLAEESRRHFSVGKGPLLYLTLFRLGTEHNVVAMTAHGLVADHRSLDLVLEELLTAYDALIKDEQPVYSTQPQPYDAYVAFQHEWTKGEVCRGHLNYWKDKLANVATVFQIPSDRPRTQSPDFQSAAQPVQIPANLVDFAQAEGVDVDKLLNAVFAVFLHRYVEEGGSDFLMGVHAPNRDRHDYRDSVGPFAGPLPLRLQIEAQQSLRDIIAACARDLKEAAEHQEIPFATLVDEIQDDHDPSRHPLFQVAFDVRHADQPIESGELHITPVLFETGLSRYDLCLRLHLTEDGPTAALVYNKTLFEPLRIERMAAYLYNVMTDAITRPDTPVSQLAFLDDQERQKILVDWNQTQRDYDDTLLHRMVEAQTEATPDAVAVIAGDQHLTYQQLNNRANQLAHHLIAQGVKPKSLVGICLPRVPDMAVAMVAALKTGAAFIPLDTSYPAERLRFVLDHAKAERVITQAGVPCEDHPNRILIDATLDDQPTHNPDIAASSDYCAYVIFTSGSTGAPKGVKTSHAAICNRVQWMQETYPVNADASVLFRMQVSFDAAVLEFFWPLASGSSLVFAKPEGHNDAEYLVELIRSYRITAVQFVPGMLEEFLDVATVDACRTLKVVICGGEVLTAQLRDRFHQVLPDATLSNCYGPTEAAVVSATWMCTHDDDQHTVPIGSPVANTRIYLLDSNLQPVPVGVPGEIFIGGAGLAIGYLDTHLNAGRFMPDPFADDEGARLYRTGDIGRFLESGAIEYLGRKDQQVKIQGYRVELGEIEAQLIAHCDIQDAIVMAREDEEGHRQLVGYLIDSAEETPDPDALRNDLSKVFPDYMIPVAFASLSSFPLTPDGKVDRKALPIPQELRRRSAGLPRAFSEVERVIVQAWREILGVENVDIHDNFFDIGGDSLLLAQVYHRLPALLKRDLKPIDLFKYPSIRALDVYLEHREDSDEFVSRKDEAAEAVEAVRREWTDKSGQNIAVVGMSCRFPGADTPDQFWENLRAGVESITFFSVDELAAEGIDSELLEDPDYIRAKGVINDIKGFDAGFFDFTPREAQITDPQHRIFLECAYEALESGGYSPGRLKEDDIVSVFGGAGNDHYRWNNIMGNPRIARTVGELPILIGNDKDNLCARIAYKLNLNGPAVGLQSACGTVLIALIHAIKHLCDGDCNIALAGGVALRSLEKEGYLYEEGLLVPPDGHTRAFDAEPMGSVPGQGSAMFLLKRMDDALRDGDHIHAVIRGSASNNDGSNKVGYTAYSADGQAKCIAAAQTRAGLQPKDITYVETSSTASPMGDPIEVEALNRVYDGKVTQKGYCGVGAVKPNIGHTDVAAGGAAFLKAAFSVKHGEIPPSINVRKVNPELGFDESPFYVNTELSSWRPGQPRRAGVNAFGLGGTNAHVIVEEPPALKPTERSRPCQLITLSAKTPTALEAMTENLVNHFKKYPDRNFNDVAYTLQVGRDDFQYRRMLVCQNLSEAVIELENRDPRRVFTSLSEQRKRPLAFLFPGQGAQYMNMGRQLYQVDLTYRGEVDRCWDIVKDLFPDFYRELSEKDRRSRTEKIHETNITQMALFIVEYALARTLMHWGLQPSAMIGNSTGEYVAATLAGVFSLEDALRLVIGRGRLMRTLPPGEMATVALSEEELLPHLNERVSLAGVASPNICMISGQKQAVLDLRAKLSEQGVISKPLFAPHAFHSYMVDTIVPKFAEMVAQIQLNEPKIPFISTITGAWITADEATDPNYWARQQRQTVRFAQGVDVLLQEPERVMIEVGPDKTLSSFAAQSKSKTRKQLILGTMRQPLEDISDVDHLLTTVGRLWMNGVDIDWEAFHQAKRCRRTPLPTYPFERDVHWIDAPKSSGQSESHLASDKIQVAAAPAGEAYRPNVATSFVAPSDPVEVAIAGFWRDFLGVDAIGVHDDFFELGGSSLIAVRLINQMSKKFGVPLASHVLLQKRTISDLAEHIRENQANPGAGDAKATPLVEIQRGNPQNLALYMVHPIGGEIYFYRDISHYMGPEQPVYGFQAPSLVGDREAFTDIKAQAAFYIEALREHQPKGPYLLGGASYGGNVALEMAQQLMRNGESVPLLVVVDSPAPGQMPSKFTDTASILEYLLGDKLDLDLSMLRGMSAEDQMSYIFEQARTANRVDVLPPTLGVPLFKTWMGHQTALHAYEPQQYPGRVLFFRPTEKMKVNPPKMYLPWIDMVKGGIEIHQVGGNHITMNFGDNAKMMAKHLHRALLSLQEPAAY